MFFYCSMVVVTYQLIPRSEENCLRNQVDKPNCYAYTDTALKNYFRKNMKILVPLVGNLF